MFFYSVSSTESTPGYCLVSDRFLCVVSPDAEHEYLMALWEVLQDEQSRLEDVLSFFARKGIARLPGFALVELVDVPTGSVVLAVRGEAQVEILGRESDPYLGAGAATWVEGAAQSVDRLSIGFRGIPDGAAELPLHRGIVRSDRLVWRTHEVAPADADPDEFTEIPAWAKAPAEPAPIDQTRQTTTLVEAQVDDDDDDHTVVMGMRPGRSQASEADEVEHDDSEDETVISNSRPSARPVSPPPPPPPSPLELSLPDGSAVDLARTVVIGRRPKPPEASGGNVRLVAVKSPTKEVSSTHVEFSLVAGAVLVRDANSTNGSIIRVPNRDPFVLKPGESVTVPEGTAVDIGDDNLVTIRKS